MGRSDNGSSVDSSRSPRARAGLHSGTSQDCLRIPRHAMHKQASPHHNVASLLLRTARCWPRLPAVACGRTVVHEYAELANRAARLAGAFATASLPAGERVAIVSRNMPEYVEALLGCWWGGLIAVPVNAKLHPRELAYVLADSGARWAFVDAAWHAAIGALDKSETALERCVEFGSAEYAALFGSTPRAEPAPC